MCRNVLEICTRSLIHQDWPEPLHFLEIYVYKTQMTFTNIVWLYTAPQKGHFLSSDKMAFMYILN